MEIEKIKEKYGVQNDAATGFNEGEWQRLFICSTRTCQNFKGANLT